MPRYARLRDVAFSWNMVAAPGYALLVYIFSNLLTEHPASDVGYYFRRSAVRINDILHLGPINAVTTSTLARREQAPWGRIGEELTILISALALVLAVFLVPRFLGRTRVNEPVLRGLAAFFAAPFCYLVVLKLTWRGPSDGSFWLNPLVIIFAAEIVCASILWLVSRRHNLPVWAKAVLYVVHFGIWVRALWMGMPLWIHPLLTPHLVLIGFPLSGIAALFSPPRSRSDASEVKAAGWSLAGIALAIGALVAVWWPGWAHDLTNPRDMHSVTIQVSRGRCFGRCPSYRLTIHNSGRVEFSGDSDERVGQRVVTITRERTGMVSSGQFRQILRELAGIRFFSIEDRAFRWCFDSASVGISISIDGKTKSVVGDASCTGAQSGVQARFVEVADEIDAIVGTNRWICRGPCQN
jgi:hypothetical protein